MIKKILLITMLLISTVIAAPQNGAQKEKAQVIELTVGEGEKVSAFKIRLPGMSNDLVSWIFNTDPNKKLEPKDGFYDIEPGEKYGLAVIPLNKTGRVIKSHEIKIGGVEKLVESLETEVEYKGQKQSQEIGGSFTFVDIKPSTNENGDVKEALIITFQIPTPK